MRAAAPTTPSAVSMPASTSPIRCGSHAATAPGYRRGPYSISPPPTGARRRRYGTAAIPVRRTDRPRTACRSDPDAEVKPWFNWPPATYITENIHRNRPQPRVEDVNTQRRQRPSDEGTIVGGDGARSGSRKLTCTVVSVMPYMLTSRAGSPGNRSETSDGPAQLRASPPNTKYRTAQGSRYGGRIDELIERRRRLINTVTPSANELDERIDVPGDIAVDDHTPPPP